MIVLALLIYYQWMRASAQSAYNGRIEGELKSVQEEKRWKMMPGGREIKGLYLLQVADKGAGTG